jgi:hypothetical protein
MIYHRWGENSSSKRLHAEPWLDFNMIQQGHRTKDMHNYDSCCRSDKPLCRRAQAKLSGCVLSLFPAPTHFLLCTFKVLALLAGPHTWLKSSTTC